MEQYTAPAVDILSFAANRQIALQAYDDSANFGDSTQITSVPEPSEGFEDW